MREVQLLASACGIPWTHVGDPIPAFAPHHQHQHPHQAPTSILPTLAPLEHMPVSQAQLIWMPQRNAGSGVANGIISRGLQGGGSGSAFTALGPSTSVAAHEQHQLGGYCLCCHWPGLWLRSDRGSRCPAIFVELCTPADFHSL